MSKTLRRSKVIPLYSWGAHSLPRALASLLVLPCRLHSCLFRSALAALPAPLWYPPLVGWTVTAMSSGLDLDEGYSCRLGYPPPVGGPSEAMPCGYSS
eukprot:1040693-Alexandrium_andersonii.AAC.1